MSCLFFLLLVFVFLSWSSGYLWNLMYTFIACVWLCTRTNLSVPLSSVPDMHVVCLPVASVLSIYLLFVCDDILTVKTLTSHFVNSATVFVDIHTRQMLTDPCCITVNEIERPYSMIWWCFTFLFLVHLGFSRIFKRWGSYSASFRGTKTLQNVKCFEWSDLK